MTRMIERREPKGDFNQGVHGMMASSIGNPLGKVSIRYAALVLHISSRNPPGRMIKYYPSSNQP